MPKVKNFVSTLKALTSRTPVLKDIFRDRAAPETYPPPRLTPQEIYGLVNITTWFYGLGQDLQASFRHALMQKAPDHHMFLSPAEVLEALDHAVFIACHNSKATRAPIEYAPEIAQIMQAEMTEKEAKWGVDDIEAMEAQFLGIDYVPPAHPGLLVDMPMPDDGDWPHCRP